MKKRKEKRQSTQQIESDRLELRQRLEQELSQVVLATEGESDLIARLEDGMQGVSLDAYLPALLELYPILSPEIQNQLDTHVPPWLYERNESRLLAKLMRNRDLSAVVRERARLWMQAAWSPTAPVEAAGDISFYQAYHYSDDSQGIIILLWFSDAQRRQAAGMSFLIDYNPPWEGAIKDIGDLPPCPLKQAVRRYVNPWMQRGLKLEKVGAAEAKRIIIQRLDVNRREKIRLPRDLVRSRQLFLEHVLTLPDLPDTLPFTETDFLWLSKLEKTAESIRAFEHAVGRRVRLPDGQEVIVMGDPFDDDDW